MTVSLASAGRTGADDSKQPLITPLHPPLISPQTARSVAGTEFHSIRDYVPNDPFKKINWKVSAKYRKLMVNQHEVEDVFDAMIFVDARELTRTGTMLRNPLEYSIKAAIAMARTMTKRTNRVGLVTYNNRIRVIGPGIGENHISMIMGVLTGTYSMGNVTLKSAINTATPYMTPRSPGI